ncbi:hypothetical protein [Treponema sp.]|uniref:hypothetical protein n=1 Tax=Treponema sp. TaxID=166 RepID=UPI0025EA7BF5|nr:hypothetical protein [Treponema sp.]MCR5217156.1 hypothetical protein [Treponema sp.]
MKSLKTFTLKTLLPAVAMITLVLAVITPAGCHSVSEGLNFIEGDFTLPKIQAFLLTGSASAEIAFTKEVVSLETEIFSKNNPEESFRASTFFDSATNTALLNFNQKTLTGCSYIIEGIAKDKGGNSVNFSIPFTGWNDSPALLALSEVRNAYGSVKQDGSSIHKTEFAEVYVLKEGNLSGLELYSLCDGEEKKYSFPPIDVKKGEYITVHMRKPEKSTSCPFDEEGALDELKEDLTLATRIDSNSGARDLWFDNTKAVFADSDIIMIRDSNKIYDCLYYSKSTFEGFEGDKKILADKILSEGIWKGEALSSDNISTGACKRSFSRQNLDEIIQKGSCDNKKDVWMITADSGSGKKKVTGVTPGYKNSSSPYLK